MPKKERLKCFQNANFLKVSGRSKLKPTLMDASQTQATEKFTKITPSKTEFLCNLEFKDMWEKNPL